MKEPPNLVYEVRRIFGLPSTQIEDALRAAPPEILYELLMRDESDFADPHLRLVAKLELEKRTFLREVEALKVSKRSLILGWAVVALGALTLLAAVLGLLR
jgi:hypothetical protein